MHTESIFITVLIFVSILTALFFKSIKRAILNVFGGSIELPEFAGVVFLGLFIHMIMKEGQRDHEWHYYNELYIFFTAGAAMTGLGLKKTLEVVKEIKLGESSKEPIN